MAREKQGPVYEVSYDTAEEFEFYLWVTEPTLNVSRGFTLQRYKRKTFKKRGVLSNIRCEKISRSSLTQTHDATL